MTMENTPCGTMAASAAQQASATDTLPELPSLLTRPLGVEGWTHLEPVLLAALATGEPMLLIGPHGTAKSLFLERLADALGLAYRFYNASLLDYDDLVGIPLPDENRQALRYIGTPSAIWDAHIAFFDEVNRTRPDLQNKLFPIIHERRVQGIRLDNLRYRWAAMKPPTDTDETSEESIDVYYGAEPLDPALADRFGFIVRVPSWQELGDDDRRRILRRQTDDRKPTDVVLDSLIHDTSRVLAELTSRPNRWMEDYLLALMPALELMKLRCTGRRAATLHRNVRAVHAARIALYRAAHPDVSWRAVDWNTSALLALGSSLPQAAEGKSWDPVNLLAAHRRAWELSRIDENDPWRRLLGITDPLERCTTAIAMGDLVTDEDLSQLILDAVASRPSEAEQRAVALAIYLEVHRSRSLLATVYETLAGVIRPCLVPADTSELHDDSRVRTRSRDARDRAARLRERAGESVDYAYAANLVASLIPDGYEQATPHRVASLFFATLAAMRQGPVPGKEN